MLAVNRQNFNAVFLCCLHDECAARDERLLVRERNLLFGFQRCERRLQADHADHRVQHDIGAFQLSQRAKAFHAAVDFNIQIAHGGAQRRGCLQIKNRNCLRFEFPDLFLQKPDIGVCGERRDLHGVLALPLYAAHDVERLCADGAR